MSVAEIYAGRYVDGTWSYTQALYEAKKRGVSKRNICFWKIRRRITMKIGIDSS